MVLDNNNNSSEGERRRERVESRSQSPKGLALEEEKWKFQAEMLRAECNLLRKEKEIAVKKLERTRVQMETMFLSWKRCSKVPFDVVAYGSNDVVGQPFNGGRCRCNDVVDLTFQALIVIHYIGAAIARP